MIPSIDMQLSFIIFLPLQKGPIALETMHDNVSNALARLEQDKMYQPGEKCLWIPQFKIGDKKAQDQMRPIDPIKNFKVVDATGSNAFVQEYVNQAVLELFGYPEAEGHLHAEIDRANDIVIDDEEFIVAMSLSKLEGAGIDMPLCVAKVTRDNWRRAD